MKLALDKIRNLYAAAVCHGPGVCAFRIGYELRKNLGLLKRRFPVRTWSELNLSRWLGVEVEPEDILQKHASNGKLFFFRSQDLPRFNDENTKRRIISDAEEILQNNLRYFFAKSHYLGQEPDWFLNPQTGRHISTDKHWSETAFFDPNVGDIKFIWEPSRFAWAYTLVRAYSVTWLEKYADKFWSLFESWVENNQPNRGPNYACGQECAIRLMAMCFALYGLAAARASSVERKIKLITAIAVHAERIEKNIDFAISTRTNHSLTEAAGLYTTGLLFPEFKDSTRWAELGKKVLTREGLRQIYADGSYIQHSMNYHRLMLQDYLWVMRLGELNGDSFRKEIVSRVTNAVEFLYENQDSDSGEVPNYGANDGSLIIPLNSCDYNDFRPVIQSCWFLVKREKLYENGPWDEDLMWLFGQNASAKPAVKKQRRSMSFSSGGYYTLRGKESWLMCRCHSYRDRVVHVDPLHVDLWADGVNLLRDSGTCGYFMPEEPQLEYYFKSIWAHNTVIVDVASPLKLVSRFTWWPLPKSKLLKFSTEGTCGEWQGENLAYCRSPWKVAHRRHIVFEEDRWEITDEIMGRGKHSVELRWQVAKEAQVICSEPHLIQLSLPEGWRLEVNNSGQMDAVLLRAEPNAGYESPFYGCKVPSATLSVKNNDQLPILFRSIVWHENKSGC
ncbi:MAG: heparinase II/III family protein [Sedimentisphaerales bacterium]|nr:heparinase II/III family protein [Sedimentisphaerales bacterium]